MYSKVLTCGRSPASVYTTNLDRALRMSSAIDSGSVTVNGPVVPAYQTPFGGFKQSGIGKELGKYGLLEYMRTKTVHIKYVHSHFPTPSCHGLRSRISVTHQTQFSSKTVGKQILTGQIKHALGKGLTVIEVHWKSWN